MPTDHVGRVLTWFSGSRQLWRKVLVTSGTRVVSAAMQLAVVVITARAFGPEGRGTIAAAWSWATFFALFAALCLGQAAAGVASRSKNQNWLGPTIATLATTTAAATFVGWIIAIAFWQLTSGAAFGNLPLSTLIVSFTALPILIWAQHQPYLLSAAGRLDLANKANFAGRCATPIGVLFAVYALHAGIDGALIGMAIGESLIALIGIRALVRSARGTIKLTSQHCTALLSDGAALLPSTLGWFLIANVQVLIVHALKGDSEAGVYQVAAFAIDALALVGASSALVVYERVALSGADNSWQEIKRLISLLIVLTALMALLAVPCAYLVFPFVFGDRFEPSTPMFLALLPTLLGRLLSALMTPQWIARGLLWQLSALYVAIGLTNVLLTTLLVDQVGAIGAAWSANVALVAVSFCHIALAVRIERDARLSVGKT